MEGLIPNHTEHLADRADLPPPIFDSRPDVGCAYRILILDTDADSLQTLHGKLAQAGFRVTTVSRSEDARAAIDRDCPHLVMLDWDLPGVVAMDLVRHVRRSSAGKSRRVVALSTLAGEHQVVSGLEMGLDDYVIKPYSIREVLARVRALLRPLNLVDEERDFLEFHRLCMHASESRVTVEDRTVSLRAAEFRLLEFLLRHPERAFHREHLLDRVWGPGCAADARAVDVTVQRIRKALAPHGCSGYLQTVRGVGYRISSSIEPC